ncbi:hypothetical protein KIPB_000057 [Kipferlia bialata]|uniref:Uncharacterized protein n=1 Tax=Kipferlia bialata TaxID=797122 RepID=A0A9K3CMT3_9EUKA|nr:hypothetical protein KIPB_000057 [Kipferlia bialata]|eukprot:g57.t1
MSAVPRVEREKAERERAEWSKAVIENLGIDCDSDSECESDCGTEDRMRYVRLKFFSRRQIAICLKVLADAPEPLLTLSHTQREVMELWLWDGEEIEKSIKSSEELDEYVRLSLEHKMAPKSLYMALAVGERKYGNPLLAETVDEGRKIMLQIYSPMKKLMRGMINNGLLGP